MKLYVKKIMALVIAGLMLFAAVPFNANAVTQNVLSYTVTNGQATIVYCDKAAVGELTIPDTLGGFPVTSIDDSAFVVSGYGGGAFAMCTRLTSITVPASLTNIWDWPFGWCDGLESISVDAGNTVYASENGVLFNKSKTELIQYPASKKGSSYTVPDSVTSIGERAFYECKGLKSITIPDSVTSIGDRAFSECLDLKNINISNSESTIGKGAFSGTAWYKKQHNGLIYAGLVACGYKGEMRKNTDVVLKPGTKAIAGGAFQFPDELTSISIPASVTSIGDGAFQGCNSLKSIDIDAGNHDYSSENGVLFNKSKTELIQYPNDKTGSSYIIPNSVKRIREDAFYLCSELTKITIPDSVVSIGARAFESCYRLTSISIPNNLKIIKDSTFSSCDRLTSIIIPNSVKSIEDSAFSFCTGLISINIPNIVTSIGDGAFLYCTGLKSITIPNSVISIGDSAFYRCTGLTNITIPGSVKSIGGKAFAECTGLKNINVSKTNKVYASENSVLFNKSKTELIQYPASKTGSSYTIPNIVKSIGDSAFDGCSGLINITVPNSVVSIGDSAFNKTAWYDNQPDGVVYAGKVACGYKGDIRYDSNMVIVLKTGTVGIAESAFELGGEEAQNLGLTGLSIPNTVTNIGDRAFYSCTDLKNVTIPKSVVNIGEQAFGYWSSLDYMDKISDLTFSCFENSAGQRYAAENGFATNTKQAAMAEALFHPVNK